MGQPLMVLGMGRKKLRNLRLKFSFLQRLHLIWAVNIDSLISPYCLTLTLIIAYLLLVIHSG